MTYNRQETFWQKQRQKQLEQREAQRQDINLMVANFAKASSAELLDSRGPLAKSLPGYQVREPQLRMARLIESAIRNSKTAVVEGGTGCGKTLSYLIPIIATGKKAVVASATLALMDQILRDLAFLKQHLGIPFTYSKQMGIGNYLCAAKHIPQAPLGLTEEHEEVESWWETTTNGDISELTFDIKKPKYRELYRGVATNSESCKGRKCACFDDCFYVKARQRAYESKIVVTTHATVAADLLSGRMLLPDHEVLVLDECHGWESNVRNAMQITATEGRLRDLVAKAEKACLTELGSGKVLHASSQFWKAFEKHFLKMRKPKPHDVRLGAGVPEGVAELAEQLCTELQHLEVALHAEIEFDPENSGSARKYLDKLFAVRRAVAAAYTQGANRVTWVTLEPGKPARLNASATEVGPWLARQMRCEGAPKSIIYTSATIETNTSTEVKFTAFKSGAGVTRSMDLREKSPFQYDQQMLYYLPPAGTISSPKRKTGESREQALKRYNKDIVPVIQQSLVATRGRAFVLFTSYDAMNLAFQTVEHSFPALTQNDMEREKLLEWFKTTDNAVLFATSSYWEGVDVPGQALSNVIIDRIPFPSPQDPLQLALTEKYGRDAFHRFSIPAATRHLQQGVGRLIRRETDRGLIVLLDPRFRTAKYGIQILRELPGFNPRKLLKPKSLPLAGKFIDAGRAA